MSRSLVIGGPFGGDRSWQATLPGYEIGSELGRGAFGVVLAGRHRQLGREVAIKRLSPGLVSNEAARARFLSEAQLLASIDHPHIVPVYDYVENADSCALVMERLAGGTVWRRFVDRGFDQRTACAIALVACSGLHGAHLRGVLHRDMKPENMLFGADRLLKVTDFGIAHVLGDDDTLATPSGHLLGTPAYMAPEQASGGDLGPPTDVYAAGVLLYELLSGRLPYPEDGGPLSIVMRHMNEDPVSLSEVAPAVPPRLALVVDKAISRDPRDRFASAEDFGIAVAEAAAAWWGAGWLEGLEVTLREPGPILASAQRAPARAAAPLLEDKVVRPSIELHTAGGAPTGVVLSDLMPMRSAPAKMPPFPTALIWAASALALIALVLGLLGVGSTVSGSSVGNGSVSVSGQVLGVDGPISVNLDQEIPIIVNELPVGDGTPQSARLVLSLGGLPVVTTVANSFQREDHAFVTVLDASAGRYLIGGKLSAELELFGTRGTVHDGFELRAARSPGSTFGGVFVIILVLVVAAYAESFLRALRRGRRRDNRAAVAALAVVGAFAGAGAALVGWLVELSAPTLVSLLVTTILGAGAGLLAGLAALQVGKRVRARRQSNRLVLLARRKPVAQPVPGPAPTPSQVGVG